jgi:hypothetical protein
METEEFKKLVATHHETLVAHPHIRNIGIGYKADGESMILIAMYYHEDEETTKNWVRGILGTTKVEFGYVAVFKPLTTPEYTDLKARLELHRDTITSHSRVLSTGIGYDGPRMVISIGMFQHEDEEVTKEWIRNLLETNDVKFRHAKPLPMQ